METTSDRLNWLEAQVAANKRAIAAEKKRIRERERSALKRRQAKAGGVVLARAESNEAFRREIAALMAAHVPEAKRGDWPELFPEPPPASPFDRMAEIAAEGGDPAEGENGTSRAGIFAGWRGGA